MESRTTTLTLENAKVRMNAKKLGLPGQPTLGSLTISHSKGTQVANLAVAYMGNDLLASLNQLDLIDLEVKITVTGQDEKSQSELSL